MSAHITRVTRRGDVRIMGRLGERVNLCGGAFTDKDILVRDARKMTVTDAAEWNVCAACIRELQRQEVNR